MFDTRCTWWIRYKLHVLVVAHNLATYLCTNDSFSSTNFTSSLRWLVFTPFTCSCCWLTLFLILMRLWHCLCCCRNGSCSYTRHDTNPSWYKLKASCCREGMPKRFCNGDTMVLIFFRCKTQTWKFMCECLPGKRIVCSASKVTTCFINI